MEFELARVLIAIAGCAAGAYYDLRNNRNIPNILLYAMLALGVLFDLVFWGQGSLLAFAVAIAIFVAGYLLYRAGQLGGADVYILSAIALLLPVQPTVFANVAPAPYPYVFSVIAASGITFMLYMLAFYGARAVRDARREKMKVDAKTALGAVLVAAAYAVFVYVAGKNGVFGPAYFVLVGFVVFVSLFFLLFKNRIARMMVEEVPFSKIEEEDVIALEYMDESVVKKYNLRRVADSKELARLAKLPLKKYCVYTKMPPFLPHILLGLLITLFFGDVLMLIVRM
ncbi:Type IV leader peptidase family protein [Candidatus Anstonella stagnisolia]|nr:Type IV leader peptidase family protein [Candidatus Anstonella stagnisolia]